MNLKTSPSDRKHTFLVFYVRQACVTTGNILKEYIHSYRGSCLAEEATSLTEVQYTKNQYGKLFTVRAQCYHLLTASDQTTAKGTAAGVLQKLAERRENAFLEMALTHH